MSWLEQLEYEHEYKCPDEHISILRVPAKAEVPPEVECPHCGQGAMRVGFKPQQLGGQLVVQYDKNGRVGYAVTTGGKTTYISKTKMEYMKTGQNTSHFSKEYERHTQDKMEGEFGKFRKQLDSKATVTSAKKGDQDAV
jgi:hypothetical protein